MAASIVQGGSGSPLYNAANASYVEIAFPSSVSSANDIVVSAASWEGGATGSSTFSTTERADSYSEVVNGTNYASIAWCSAPGGGTTTVRFTPSTGTYVEMAILEVSGLNTTDGSSSGGGNSNPMSSGTVATTTAGLLVGVLKHDFGGAKNIETTSPVWNVQGEDTIWDYAGGSFAWKIVTSSGSYAAVWNPATERAYWAIIAAFAESAGGGGTEYTRDPTVDGILFPSDVVQLIKSLHRAALDSMYLKSSASSGVILARLLTDYLLMVARVFDSRELLIRYGLLIGSTTSKESVLEKTLSDFVLASDSNANTLQLDIYSQDFVLLTAPELLGAYRAITQVDPIYLDSVISASLKLDRLSSDSLLLRDVGLRDLARALLDALFLDDSGSSVQVAGGAQTYDDGELYPLLVSDTAQTSLFSTREGADQLLLLTAAQNGLLATRAGADQLLLLTPSVTREVLRQVIQIDPLFVYIPSSPVVDAALDLLDALLLDDDKQIVSSGFTLVEELYGLLVDETVSLELLAFRQQAESLLLDDNASARQAMLTRLLAEFILLQDDRYKLEEKPTSDALLLGAYSTKVLSASLVDSLLLDTMSVREAAVLLIDRLLLGSLSAREVGQRLVTLVDPLAINDQVYTESIISRTLLGTLVLADGTLRVLEKLSSDGLEIDTLPPIAQKLIEILRSVVDEILLYDSSIREASRSVGAVDRVLLRDSRLQDLLMQLVDNVGMSSTVLYGRGLFREMLDGTEFTDSVAAGKEISLQDMDRLLVSDTIARLQELLATNGLLLDVVALRQWYPFVFEIITYGRISAEHVLGIRIGSYDFLGRRASAYKWRVQAPPIMQMSDTVWDAGSTSWDSGATSWD